MCIDPYYQMMRQRDCPDSHEEVALPCGGCWQCLKDRINDFVGRMLCEASESMATVAITLTYRDCPEREIDFAHQKIYPRHFQLFVKAMRKAGHKIRYFVAGEYGKEKGRAHFHAILFFYPSKRKPHPPIWEQEKNIHIDAWPHGHVFCDWQQSERTLRYVVKYLLKEADRDQLGQIRSISGDPKALIDWHSMSKRPALGMAYFEKLARRQIEYKVPPNSFAYMAPGADANKKRKFTMQGATRRDYCLLVYDLWLEEIGEFPWERIPEAVAKVFQRSLIWRAEKESEFDEWQQFKEKFSDDLKRGCVPWKKRDNSAREEYKRLFTDDAIAEGIRDAEARVLTIQTRIANDVEEKKTRAKKKAGTFEAKGDKEVAGENSYDASESEALDVYCRVRSVLSEKEKAKYPCCREGSSEAKPCQRGVCTNEKDAGEENEG